jgi:hypothetical protein
MPAPHNAAPRRRLRQQPRPRLPPRRRDVGASLVAVPALRGARATDGPPGIRLHDLRPLSRLSLCKPECRSRSSQRCSAMRSVTITYDAHPRSPLRWLIRHRGGVLGATASSPGESPRPKRLQPPTTRTRGRPKRTAVPALDRSRRESLRSVRDAPRSRPQESPRSPENPLAPRDTDDQGHHS